MTNDDRTPRIVGISGSPFAGGNTDRMVRALLEQSGQEHLFVNLSSLRYTPCKACAHLCAETNLCPVEDDLKPYFKPLLEADAWVFGTPTHSGNMSAWLYSFLSRLWCFYHMKRILQNKPLVLAVTAMHGKSEEIIVPRMKDGMRNYKIVGHVFFSSTIPPCYTCGVEKACHVGALWRILGKDEEKLKDFQITEDKFKRWEDCPRTVEQIRQYARILSHECT